MERLDQSKTALLTSTAVLERLDDIVIAQMITERFQGPFVSAELLLKRLSGLIKERWCALFP